MNINPVIWFSERELKFVPKHFIKCPSLTTAESRHWIYNKSQGRFAFSEGVARDFKALVLNTMNEHYVYFEDRADATMYELLWTNSG